MPRIARVVVPGYPHHVTQRGVRSMDVFWSDEDRLEYLHHIKEQGKRFGVRYEGWCLMTNHVHLIAVPEDPRSLALGVGEAHRRYTRAVNFRQGKRGYLFQGRFSSCVLEEPHLVASVQYIERNPVRARIVRRAWDWAWSSARFRVGDLGEDRLVAERNPFGIALDWRQLLLEDPKQMDFIREQSRTGRPCGGDGFLDLVERLTGRSLRPSPGGRPRKPRRR
jgi:putative transposase